MRTVVNPRYRDSVGRVSVNVFRLYVTSSKHTQVHGFQQFITWPSLAVSGEMPYGILNR